jgi:hypothetical protein
MGQNLEHRVRDAVHVRKEGFGQQRDSHTSRVQCAQRPTLAEPVALAKSSSAAPAAVTDRCRFSTIHLVLVLRNRD